MFKMQVSSKYVLFYFLHTNKMQRTKLQEFFFAKLSKKKKRGDSCDLKSVSTLTFILAGCFIFNERKQHVQGQVGGGVHC